MKFRVGVTGGIGSGKSTVCKAFEVLGIPVFYSDDEARIIMDTNMDLRIELNRIFGTDLYPEGKLDRPALASIIFNDEAALEQVNRLVHPLVLDAFDRWPAEKESKYVILESAILFESRTDWATDKIVAVVAPLEERIMRVMERNNISRDEVLDRIKNQISEGEMLRKADFLIRNADNDMVLPQVISIHNEIINLIESF